MPLTFLNNTNFTHSSISQILVTHVVIMANKVDSYWVNANKYNAPIVQYVSKELHVSCSPLQSISTNASFSIEKRYTIVGGKENIGEKINGLDQCTCEFN